MYSLRNRFWLPYRRYAAWSAFLADPRNAVNAREGFVFYPRPGV